MLGTLVLDLHRSDDGLVTGLTAFYGLLTWARVFADAREVFFGAAAVVFAFTDGVAGLVGCAHFSWGGAGESRS